MQGCSADTDISFRALGHSQVAGRIIAKRIHVRVEHIKPSRCREDYLQRVVANDAIKHEAKAKGGEFAA